MMPTNEIDILTMIVTDALDFAPETNIADGYACLVRGLHRANPSADYSPPQTLARHPSAELQRRRGGGAEPALNVLQSD